MIIVFYGENISKLAGKTQGGMAICKLTKKVLDCNKQELFDVDEHRRVTFERNTNLSQSGMWCT